MKRRWHFLLGILLFLFLWIIIPDVTITLILIPIAMTIFPDVDGGTRYHRHSLTHNSIIWVVVYLFNPGMLTALVCLAIGFHLITDLTLYPSKWTGLYTIKFISHSFPKKAGVFSTLWLLVNFFLSLIPLFCEVFFL